MFTAFQIQFMQKALIVCLITGGFLSFLGVYIVLRRIVFVGIALSQITACGFALGFLLWINPSICAVIFTLIGVILLSVRQTEKKIPHESAIGLSYALASSLGILFVAKSPQAETHILNLLSGNILTITNSQVYTSLAVFSFAAVSHYLFYKQFIFVSFDSETSSTSGLNTKLWNFIFYLILGIVISTSIKTSGVILTFGYMVIPAVSALIAVRNLKKVFFISVIFGLIASFFGLYLSFILDLPSGPTIVVVLCILSGLIWLIKKLF